MVQRGPALSASSHSTTDFSEASIQTKVEEPLAKATLPSYLTALRPSLGSFLTFKQAIFPRTRL